MQVRGDREVVRVVVDERQPAEVARSGRGCASRNSLQLLGRLDEEVGPLEGGVGRELAEQVVAARASIAVRRRSGLRSAVVLEVRAHPLPEEHRVVSFEDPLAGPMAERPGGLVGLEPVERRRSRAGRAGSRCRSPSRGPRCTSRGSWMPNFSSYSLHLAREQGLHEELEERVAAAADGEVGREHGHGLAVSAGAWSLGRRLLSHAAVAVSPPAVRRLGVGGAGAGSSARRPRARRRSASRLASGRRRPRRSAATRRSRKMTVWPANEQQRRA